jgi:hypothetical protein
MVCTYGTKSPSHLWLSLCTCDRRLPMQVLLIRKFADVLNGVDLRRFSVGDVIDLEDRLAYMLLAEGWAEPFVPIRAATADDRNPRRRRAKPEIA